MSDKLKALVAKLSPTTFERNEVIAFFPVADEKKHGIVAFSQQNETIDNLFGDLVVRQCTQFEGSFILDKRNEVQKDV